MLEKIIYAQKCLADINEDEKHKVCVGFDGYVDSIVRPVCGTGGDGEKKYFRTIQEFGEYIQSKASKSCSIELHKEVKKSGGNAFLFASMLAKMKVRTRCIGAFGFPEILEVFQPKNQNLDLVSISEPGYCSALEFRDGKIMLADNTDINGMDYQMLTERVGEAYLLKCVEETDALAFMNWSEVQGSTDIWQGYLHNIFPKLKGDKKRQMFLDLSDCSGRNEQEIRYMLELICQITEYFEVILSLNSNEFQVIGNILDGRENQTDHEGTARRIREHCRLKYLFIHLCDSSYGINNDEILFVKNRFIKDPILSTGGGDNFNAGLLYSLLNGLDMESAMIVANAASGYYIMHGRSAAKEELLQYIEEWKKELT